MVFCSRCGKELDNDARFCPVCGFDTSGPPSGNVNGGGYNQNNNPQNNSGRGRNMGGTLSVIFLCGLLWAVLHILGAIALVAIYGFISDIGLSYSSIYPLYGLIPEDLYIPYLVITSIFGLLSAVCALICCRYLYKLENHKRACMSCLIGSIFALCGGSLVGIVGIVFYFLIKNEKNRFSS